MTTFKEIRGKLIRTLDTDPTPATNYEGEIWYNKTIGVLKGATLTPSSWSSGGNLSTARAVLGGAGTATATLAYGGKIGPAIPTGVTGVSEEYNGTSWTSGGSLSITNPPGNYGKAFASAGTQTAALNSFGADGPGNALTFSEEYNGSTWTAANPGITAKRYTAGFGIQTAAVSAGNSPIAGDTEEYNGTSWTAGNVFNNPRRASSAVGIQTAGLMFGGSTPSPTANESYDGTSWTTLNPVNTGRAGGGGAGTQTLASFYGGSLSTQTELWDGTSWTVDSATLGNTIQSANGVGSTQTAGIYFGGETSPTVQSSQTEEYVGSSYNNVTLTTS